MHIAFGDGNAYDAGLTASVPLYTGSRLSSTIGMQEAQVDAQRAALDASVLQLRAQVALAYHGALLAQRSIAIFDAQLRFLGEQLAIRRALLAEGQALAYDTLVLATRGTQLRVDRASAEEQRDRALLLLGFLTGLEDGIALRDDAQPASDLAELTAEQLLARACVQRPELRGIAAARSAGEQAVAYARAAFYPSVAASAAYRVGRPGMNQVANEWMGYWTAGIRAEWNLWAWGADSRAAQKAEIEVRKADASDEQLRARLRMDVAVLHNELGLRRQRMALLDAQAAQEREKLALTAARVREGLATASDLVEAETALTAAMLRREQTAIEYAKTLAELETTVGQQP
jgi:outer membrane protein TolC